MTLFSNIYDIQRQILSLIKEKHRQSNGNIEVQEWSLSKINDLDNLIKELVELCEEVENYNISNE